MNKLGAAINAILGKMVSLGSSSSSGIEIGSIGINTPTHIRFSYKYFCGSKTRGIRACEGKTITINYSSEVVQGELNIQILDHQKESLIKLESGVSGTKEITATKNSIYQLVISGIKTEGGFDIKWSVK